MHPLANKNYKGKTFLISILPEGKKKKIEFATWSVLVM